MTAFAITNDLAWNVSKRPLFFTGNDGVATPIAEKVAVVRDDTGSFLGTVSPDYETVQNSVLLGMIQPMIDEGLLELKNVGYLNGGSRVFAQAQVCEEFHVLGESYRGFITLLNGHVGNNSVAIGPSNVRVICGNTFAMSYSQIGEKFRHSAGVNERVLESTAITDYVNGAMRKYAEYMEPLALAPCSSVQFRNALEVIYEKDVKDMRASFVDQLNSLFYSGAGNEGRTYADAFNAVTDYNSNQSRKTVAGRFNYSNFGSGARVAQRAMAVLSELAAV
jgi:phage/plasmid-like protein (TIGR03299 family)